MATAVKADRRAKNTWIPDSKPGTDIDITSIIFYYYSASKNKNISKLVRVTKTRIDRDTKNN